MILAIDPDVFEASLSNPEVQRALEWVWENFSCLHFALDRGKVLEQEYRKLLDTYPEHQERIGLRTLHQILNYAVPRTHRLHTWLSPAVTSWIDQCKCNTPVEPTLVAMGVQAPKLGLTVLLAEPPGVRTRVLHDPVKRAKLHKILGKLTVVIAANTRISFPALEQGAKSERGLWFEDKVKVVIREIYECPHCYAKTPKPLEYAVGDIDFYGYESAGDPRRIWIGECKLREVSDSDWITGDEVLQLERKLGAIEEFEESRADVEDGQITLVKYIISNATNMTDEAWELSERIGAHFVHVELSDGWRAQQRWNILRVEELKSVKESDGSRWTGERVAHQVLCD